MMADIVNPQITDAVSQANQALDHAPAAALGNLYMATAQALAIAAQNAVSNQQQSYGIVQAATAQGIAQLYEVDSASTNKPQTLVLDELTDKIKTVKSQMEESLQRFQAIFPKADACAEPDSLHAGGFGEWSRATVNAFAASLDCLSETQHRQSLRALQIAATASTLAAAAKSPEQVQHYERLLAMIKDLV